MKNRSFIALTISALLAACLTYAIPAIAEEVTDNGAPAALPVPNGDKASPPEQADTKAKDSDDTADEDDNKLTPDVATGDDDY